MLYLAIDQHRKQLTVDLRDESGDLLMLAADLEQTAGSRRLLFSRQELRRHSNPTLTNCNKGGVLTSVAHLSILRANPNGTTPPFGGSAGSRGFDAPACPPASRV